ncbi:MAG: hypothetical protein K0M45_09375 [Candidatus Paracaedibacteraceae bacterium]|nr:hypothetical protein [Candidatus Paracaedibacteraceae bacterium]
MNLPRIVFLYGSLLMLNFTASQAQQDAVIEQGEGSSSVSAASTALTPLAQDAREFIKVWELTPRFINDEDDEDPLRIYEGYINQIIETEILNTFLLLILSIPFILYLKISLLRKTEKQEKMRLRYY